METNANVRRDENDAHDDADDPKQRGDTRRRSAPVGRRRPPTRLRAVDQSQTRALPALSQMGATKQDHGRHAHPMGCGWNQIHPTPTSTIRVQNTALMECSTRTRLVEQSPASRRHACHGLCCVDSPALELPLDASRSFGSRWMCLLDHTLACVVGREISCMHGLWFFLAQPR